MAKRRTNGNTGKKQATKKKAAASRGSNGSGGGGNGDGGQGSLFEEENLERIALREAAQARYLNYSMSVITSRALPDVRDGLKPVQRRILYTMYQLRLTHTAKYRKCAKVVGDVMGLYHPHGDSAIYDALVRMAQPFSLRATLVDGNGNFGSIDGDNAAAYRYTECRLTAIASEVLNDLSADTVNFQNNYDGTRQEPVVLPSRVPNLLVNGATGIAVGMATNIPPHNLGEVCRALLKLLNDFEIKEYQLVAKDAVQGPDFPTGGHIINSKEELRDIYRDGQGTIRMRGESKTTGGARGPRCLQITSVPYAVNKAALVERISDLVFNGKMPLIQSVTDLSTDDICIELELKKDADENKVLAFLYKHTQLQTNFNVNITCLVPTESDVGQPARLGLKPILMHFLQFRLEVVTRRLENELRDLDRRIHILEGFVIVFDALDEIIRIIRKSDGKADAAEKIMKRFPADKGGLDAEQTDAILELKLYRLARLEINLIQEELKGKRKRAREIRRLLKEDTKDPSASGRWGIVREEIQHLLDTFGKAEEARRRTKIMGEVEDAEYSEEDFIIAEDCYVMLTADGWVKRQREIKDPTKSRIREGDRILTVLAGSTRATIGFFSSLGTCYTARFADIPASTGYGEPIQKLFKMKDGEKIVAAMSFDPRMIGDMAEDPKDPNVCPETHGFAASSDGYSLRFTLEGFAEVSTRSGRRYARPKKGEAIVDAVAIHGDETILAVSAECRAVVCPVEEVNYLSGPGKGVMLIKLSKTDKLLGFKASTGERDVLTVETNRGAQKNISTVKYRTTSRGGRGVEIQKNGKIARIVYPDITVPELAEE